MEFANQLIRAMRSLLHASQLKIAVHATINLLANVVRVVFAVNNQFATPINRNAILCAPKPTWTSLVAAAAITHARKGTFATNRLVNVWVCATTRPPATRVNLVMRPQGDVWYNASVPRTA
jgi:hypothetical protein